MLINSAAGEEGKAKGSDVQGEFVCLQASQDSQIGYTYLNLDIEQHRKLKEDEKNKDPAERIESYPDA